MRAALKRALVVAGGSQHLRCQFGMRRFAPVRRAGQRQLPVVEAERIGRTTFHQRQRLDRLHRRAWKDRLRYVADLDEQLARIIADRHRAAMRALDAVAAQHLDQNRIGHCANLLVEGVKEDEAQTLVGLAVRDIGEQNVVDQ